MDDLFLKLLTFPFTLLGNALRTLSLSGTAGNIAAIALYLLLAALPLLLKIKKKWKKEDWLLPVTSAVLLYSLYYFINPGLRPVVLNNSVGSLSLAFMVYSLLIFWGIIKLLQNCDTKDGHYIYRVLTVLIYACIAVVLLAGPVLGFFDFRATVAAVKKGNTSFGINLTPTICFLFLSYLAQVLAAVLDAALLFFGVKFLRELEQDPYSEAGFTAAQKLKTLCRRFLFLTIGSRLFVNLAQILFSKQLYKVDTAFTLPLGSIALTVGLYVLVTLLYQGKQLKEDNELFI